MQLVAKTTFNLLTVFEQIFKGGGSVSSADVKLNS